MPWESDVQYTVMPQMHCFISYSQIVFVKVESTTPHVDNIEIVINHAHALIERPTTVHFMLPGQ